MSDLSSTVMSTVSTKKPYQSMTIWANLLLAGAAFFPSAKDFVSPDLLGAIFFVVNTILRFKTNQGISLKL